MCYEFSLLIENPCRISSYPGFKHYDVTLPVARIIGIGVVQLIVTRRTDNSVVEYELKVIIVSF